MDLPERNRIDRTARPDNMRRLAGRYFAPEQDCGIFTAGRCFEAVVEALKEHLQGRAVGIGLDPAVPVIGDDAKIIDAVRVVGMIVGVEHAVEQADARVEQLVAAVRRGVDENIGRPLIPVALHEQRASPPPVLRIGGVASAPAAADARNPA